MKPAERVAPENRHNQTQQRISRRSHNLASATFCCPKHNIITAKEKRVSHYRVSKQNDNDEWIVVYDGTNYAHAMHAQMLAECAVTIDELHTKTNADLLAGLSRIWYGPATTHTETRG